MPKKVTELNTAASVKSDAKLVITQDESGTEVVERAGLSGLLSALKNLAGFSSHNHVMANITDLDGALAAFGCDLYFDESTHELFLMDRNGNPLSEGIEISGSGGGGLSFDGGYVAFDEETEKYFLHLTKQDPVSGEDEDIEGFTPIEIPAGGGGETGTGVITFRNTSGGKKITAIAGNAVNLTYTWSSKDAEGSVTGPAESVLWFVNSVQVMRQENIAQGAQSFDISPYLDSGVNNVRIRITDEYGLFKEFTWQITSTVYSVSWALPAITNYITNTLTFRLNSTGATGAGIVKTLKVSIDGTVFWTKTGPAESESVTIPAQSHGSHEIAAWMDVSFGGGTPTSTNVLHHTGIWTQSGTSTVVIAVGQSAYSAQRYSTTSIPWMVVKPAGGNVTVTRKIGGTTVGSVTVASGEIQHWDYRPTTAGTVTLRLQVGQVYQDISFTATELPHNIVPVTANLLMDVDPNGHNNADNDRTSFGYASGHAFTFSEDFDWVNGGFQTDEDGVTAFVIRRGDSITFDRSLFLTRDNTNGESGSTGTGKHISMIFKVTNVTDYDTKIAECFADNLGIKFFAHNAMFQAGNSMVCQYAENQKVELGLNIDPTKASMKFWLAGTPAKGQTFLTGDTKTSFAQSNPEEFVIGSDDCDIWLYHFRMYTASLTDREILQNYIADCGDVEEMIDRYTRNDIYTDGVIDMQKLMTAAPDLHIITIETAGFPADKGSAGNTTCKITHRIGNNVEADQWYSNGAKYTLQGTSSMNYRQVAGNLDINMKNSGLYVIGTDAPLTNGYSLTEDSIPVKYFNLKANVASSESANNVCVADLFNTYNPLVSKAKSVDSRVRDTVEGHPCAVFIKNTGSSPLLLGVSGARTINPGDTILYFCGDMNNSKKNTAVFGETGEWDGGGNEQCCIEFLENTYSRCTFKSHDFDQEGWKEDDSKASHFEFRYPDGAGTAGMKANFIAMHEWVYSTDPTAATNANLPLEERFGSYTRDTAEYRRAKFKRQLADYFNVPNLLFYYLFTEFFLAVDNRAKNMFMSFEPDENDVWRWNVSKNYDDDTVLGIDNKGNFVWGEAYGIEDTDGYEETVDGQTETHPYFNAAESVLWCNVRDCFETELATAYNTYESAGLFVAANIIQKFDTYQRIRPEALMIDDYAGKYDAPIVNASTASWMVDMEHGEKRDQRRQFLTYQEKYFSSKYVSAKAKADIIRFQAKPGANFSSAIEMTPYSHMYVGMLRDNTPAGKTRLKKGETATVQCLDGDGNPLVLVSGELNIQLINGSNLMHVDNAAYLYPGQVSITNGEKLQDILLGGDSYSSANLSSLSLTTVPLVQKIDLRGQSGLSGELDLTRCTLLEEIYLAGVGYVNVYLPQGRRLKTAALGSKVRTLHARNLPELDMFSCTGENLTNVWIENAPGIDTQTLLTNATNLVRGRLTEVNWILDNADLLTRLATLKGLDEQGNPLDEANSFVLTGVAHVTNITNAEIATVTAAFTELVLTYDNIVSSHTVTFKNYNGDVLNTQTVRHGADAINPVTAGLIPAPTKPSTVEKKYTYTGWDNSLTNITANKICTAQFSESVRTYRVRFYDGDVLLQTNTVEVYGYAVYTGADLVPDDPNAFWLGFDRSTANVTSDIDAHALYVTPTLPDTVATGFDFLYSDDAEDNSGYTLAEFFGIIETGHAKDYFELGDKVKIVLGTTVCTDTAIILQVIGFNHYKKQDSNNFASVVFHMIGLMNSTRRMNATNTNTGGWASTELRGFLNNTLFPELPRHWQSMIKSVQVMSSAGNQSSNITTSNDKLFLLSSAEVGFSTSEVPYKNEVDAGSENLTFPVFVTNTDRVRKTFNGEGTAGSWWLRSPNSGQSTSFQYVYNSGNASTNNASNANALAWGFCI